MQHYISKIGRGPKAWKDLTWEEAKGAVGCLMEGRATPIQIGAFLLGMRQKTESVTELAAFLSTARSYVAPLPGVRAEGLVDVPVYGGKRDTFHAVVGAAIVAASAGARVLMHGFQGDQSRLGPGRILEHLGLPTGISPSHVGEHLETLGLSFLDIALYHPPVGQFLNYSAEMGVSNVFHMVATLLNPARAHSQVVGVVQQTFVGKTVEALKLLGSTRSIVMHGVEGNPELSIAGSTKMMELRNDHVFPLVLHPEDIGLTCRPFREMAGFTASVLEQESTLLRRLLTGEVRGGQLDWILMNAGLLLYVVGKAPSITAGYSLGKKAMDSGAVAKKLEALTGDRSLGVAKKRMAAPSEPPLHRPEATPSLVPSGVVS